MKIKDISFKNKAIILFLIVFVFLLTNNAFAQKRSKKKSKNWRIEVGLASTYDNNILKYSDKYLDRFMNNEDDGRFHISTYDDLILNPTINTSYTFRIYKKLKSKIYLNLSTKIYTVNSIKNFNFASIAFRQDLSKKANFKLGYSYIPYFYIRHFRDDDWVDAFGYTKETFKPMGFAKDNFSFEIQNTFLKNTRVKYYMAYMKYYYNEHYTEYNSTNFLSGIKVYQPINKSIKLALGYEFVTSNAQGYDELIETKETSDDSDGTYVSDLIIFGVNWKLPKLKKYSNSINVDSKFYKQYFSSMHFVEDDPTHAGRVDNNFRVYSTYKISLSKKMKLSLYYNYLFRKTISVSDYNMQYLSDEKDYNQSQIGIKITYRLL